MNDPKDWTIQEKNSGLIFNIAGSLWINSLSEVLKLARNMWSTISCFKQISFRNITTSVYCYMSHLFGWFDHKIDHAAKFNCIYVFLYTFFAPIFIFIIN